ncbi:hypothetical protein DH2020_014498 [Rehmannia glutinosa]|uniref:Uncharacterized protein n=1 Tax=Rehmannia glutinosa TaxID=99300 RepID=A0ABR0WY40_REHGL
MATILSPNPAMQDLKLTFQESTLVFPSQQTHKRPLFLSNLEQFLNFNAQIIHFFQANPDFPPETVAQRLRMAVEKVLVPYDFMAGRIKWNGLSGRAEIECNGAGAGFVVACSELSVDEIGDLFCPNLGFKQLAVQRLENLDDHDQPLCVFQITSFKCGGFAIGMSINHMLFDGLAAKLFHENLASLAFDDQNKHLPFIPFHNRHLLAARSPPLVAFPHPDYIKPDDPVLGLSLPGSKQELDYRVLKITPKDIGFLKSKAKPASDHNASIKITSHNVVAALIWRCRALSSCDIDKNKDKQITILYAVDIRSRMNNALPLEYCGNAVLGGYALAKCEDIEKWPFSELVRMVSEGIARVTDEYVKSAIDWLEVNKGMPFGDCMVTSWLRLGFDQVEFPWGKPACCVPVANQFERVCYVFPGADGDINVLVQRPAEDMERFQFHFHNFFANDT